MRLISENNELFEESTRHLFGLREIGTFRDQLLRQIERHYKTDHVSLLFFRHDKWEEYSKPGGKYLNLQIIPYRESLNDEYILFGSSQWPAYLNPLKKEGLSLLVLIPVLPHKNAAVLLGWKHKQEMAYEDKNEIKRLKGRLCELLGFYELLEQNQQLKKADDSKGAAAENISGLLFQNFPGILFLLDQEGRILKWNSKSEEALGFTTSEMLQMSLLRLFKETDRELSKKILEEAFQTGFASMENSLVSKKGIKRSYSFTFHRYQHHDESLLLLQGHDISHSKQLEGSLRKISNHLRHIINSDILCYIKWNKNFEILDWSETSAQTFGWSLQEVKGRHILSFKFLHPDDKNRAAQAVEEFLKGELDSSRHELKHVTKNDRVICIQWYTTAIKDEEGNITSYLSLGSDITERNQMEQDLLETNQQFQAILKSSPVSIVTFDEEARVQSWNQAAQHTFGYTEEEVMGLEAPYLPEARKADFRKKIQEIKKGQVISDWVLRMKRKDQSELLVKVNAGPIKDVRGNISGIIAVQEDVTAQERLKESLNEEKVYRESILQNLQTLVIACDAEGKVNLYNSTAKSYLNKATKGSLPKSLEEALDIYTADGSRKLQGDELPLQRALQGEVISDQELMIKKGETSRVFSCNANMIRDSRGKKIGALLSMEDITEKKESLREFVDEKEFSDAILSSLPGIFYVINVKGQFVQWNQRFREVSQYSQEEISHLEAVDFIAEEDRERVAGAIQKVFEEGEARIEASFLSKEGRKIPYFFTGHSFWKNGEHYLVGMGIDISERREAEESRERLVNILEATTDFVGVFNDEGDCLYLNAEGMALCGISKLHNISLFDCVPVWMEGMIHEEIIPEADEKGIWRGVAALQDKEEQEIPVSLVLIAHHSEDDRYYSIIARDISHQMLYEKKLTDQNEELKKINAELDRFVYSASHDLRAPLVSILGLINVARLSPNLEEFPQYLDLMEDRVSRLDTFIQDIEDFSRNSRLSVKQEALDFNELIEESRENLKFTKGAEKVSLFREVRVDAPFYSDKSRLMIVINNLISNAIRYSNPEREDAFIKIVVEADEEKAIIRVEDNGQGIAIEYQEKIFDMFFRASTTNVGSGLGLFIVRETLEKLGGTISVESRLGEYTIFTIVIPNLKSEVNNAT